MIIRKRLYVVLLLLGAAGCGEPTEDADRLGDDNASGKDAQAERPVVPVPKVLDVPRREMRRPSEKNRRRVTLGEKEVANAEGGNERVVVTSYQNERRPGFVNSDGQLAVPAMTCSNPRCTGEGPDGGPFLVYYRMPDIKFRSDGTMYRIDIEPPAARCPACGQVSLLEYKLPEAVTRRAELLDELKAARAARWQGKGNSDRTPSSIMQDLSELPRLYLLTDKPNS
jgi:hypothetical protein